MIQQKKRKNDEHFNLKINLQDVYFGCKKTFNIMRKVICNNCRMKCHKCNYEWVPRKLKHFPSYYTCPNCQIKTRINK